jgi:hypothetical protein
LNFWQRRSVTSAVSCPLSQVVSVSYENDGLAADSLSLSLSDSPIDQGDKTTLSGTFTDTGTQNGCTVTIDWNHANPGTDTTTLTLDPGETSFDSDPHTYSDPGNYTIQATVTDGDQSISNTASLTVNRLWPEISVGASIPTAAESQPLSPGEFTLSRMDESDSGLAGAVTVYYTIGAGSSATPGSDYSVSAGTGGTCGVTDGNAWVQFAAESASMTLEVAPLDAGLVGGSKTVTIDLSSSPDDSYVVASDYSSATVTIYDDDLPTVSVAATTATATETGSAGQFTVSLANSVTLDHDLLVPYTLGGTAANGCDYSILPGDVIIPAGQSSATICVSPIDQGIIGGSRTVVLSLGTGSEYNLDTSHGAATVTIEDVATVGMYLTGPIATGTADGQVTLVSNHPAPTGGLTVSVNVPSLSQPLTATIAAGQTSRTLAIPPISGSNHQSEIVSLSQPSGCAYTPDGGASSATITNDTDGTLLLAVYADLPLYAAQAGYNNDPYVVSGYFTIVRGGSLSSSATIDYTESGTAVNGTDYQSLSGSVTMSSNESTATVEIEPTDSQPFSGSKTVTLSLQQPSGGPRDLFICRSTGAVQATASIQAPEGMEVTPREMPFALPAEGGHKTLVFKVRNDRWGKDLVRLRPTCTFRGESAPIEHVYPGTNVIRDRQLLDYQPLDDKGLTFYGAFDKNQNRACSPRNITGWGNRSYYHEGVKGWCLDSGSCTFLDPFKTVDFRQGTATIWIRRDPSHKNENQYRPDPADTWKHPLAEGYGYAELIMGDEGAQSTEASKSGVGLRRWPGWEGQRGYLEATFRAMSNRKYYCQAPFDWTDQWQHLALLWHAGDRRLEIYIDGKLAAKADPGDGEWHTSPWDRGRPGGGSNGGWSLGSSDHGKKFYTLRDEVYIYNRALSAEEIRANMERTRK